MAASMTTSNGFTNRPLGGVCCTTFLVFVFFFFAFYFLLMLNRGSMKSETFVSSWSPTSCHKREKTINNKIKA
ncbi:Uncharacterized protein APZ42_020351 [Daphnia magna]|uniref:Uncharacterized protein n=1 Tax=Daphnia magna TaxID=35525 RepID=A0A164XK40_9CRUS|nr:Uncharacterized protein APZ42_020351 [Daphnia magna]